MKKLGCLLSIALLSAGYTASAPAQVAAPAAGMEPAGSSVSVELLSDTDGVRMDPYMKNLIAEMKGHWLPLVSDVANRPTVKREETLIRLTIGQDGQLLAMQLEGPTHDDVLDKAAWNATKETSFSPLPTGMREANLKLRVHFVVNQ